MRRKVAGRDNLGNRGVQYQVVQGVDRYSNHLTFLDTRDVLFLDTRSKPECRMILEDQQRLTR